MHNKLCKQLHVKKKRKQYKKRKKAGHPPAMSLIITGTIKKADIS